MSVSSTPGKNTIEKVTEHEVPVVTTQNIRMVNPPALDFSCCRSIHLVKNCRREISGGNRLHGFRKDYTDGSKRWKKSFNQE